MSEGGSVVHFFLDCGHAYVRKNTLEFTKRIDRQELVEYRGLETNQQERLYQESIQLRVDVDS